MLEYLVLVHQYAIRPAPNLQLKQMPFLRLQVKEQTQPTTMAFDDLHSGADHHYYAHHDVHDFHVSETGERVIIVLSVATVILSVFAIGYIATKERGEHSATKNQ